MLVCCSRVAGSRVQGVLLRNFILLGSAGEAFYVLSFGIVCCTNL